MLFIADEMRIIACRSNEEEQRLHPRIAGALVHDVKQLSVRLSMQFIEDNAVGIKAVLVRHSRRKFRLALLFRNLNICGTELPVAVFLYHTEQVADYLLLPVDKLEGLSRPCAFGMAQMLDEHHGIISEVLVIAGGIRHELGRLIFLQFPYCQRRLLLPKMA
nr:MAG TPA: hypothetical protein [Caudoviricetes sp.]